MPSWIAVFRLGCRVEIMDWRGDKLSTETPRQPSDRQGKCCEVGIHNSSTMLQNRLGSQHHSYCQIRRGST